ncbi:MAG: hypothetical protein JST75_17090 [Bacteroidetes bacterium]|nr:hypothetical protein [Bacteroidota bacterium]
MLFEKIINTVFSFGAAIVVFGAWGKLEHKDFSDSVLTIGMLVETGIFCIYGMMEWRKKSGTNEQSSGESSTEGGDVSELTTTMKQTNEILNKVFR